MVQYSPSTGADSLIISEFCAFSWWTKCLAFDKLGVQELADTSPEAKPLRRRAALLVGQWVVKLPAVSRPAAYRALLSLMADEDTALQLAAVSF